jgi:hypothetical protein
VATIIKLKRSTVSSSVPTTSDLSDGEVAVNIADRKLYIRNGGSIVEVANNTSAGSTDLSNVGSSIIPDTDNTYDVGSLAAAFRDIFVGRNIKTRCNVFTNAGGLVTAATEFAFKVNTVKKVFDEVYTESSGLGSKAISQTNFDDNNPAFLF